MNFPNSLNVAVLNNLHLFDVNISESGHTDIIGGCEFKFLELLSNVLNFSYDVKVPDDMEWGTIKKDGQYSGLIGMVNISEVDIALSKLRISINRMEDVDFTHSYEIGCVLFATSATIKGCSFISAIQQIGLDKLIWDTFRNYISFQVYF